MHKEDPATNDSVRRGSHLARRARAVSVWSILAGVVVFAIAFGLRPWVIAAAGFALVYAAVNRALSKRIEELFERQPDLQLVAKDGADLVSAVASTVPAPWPFDHERIVANEIERLGAEADASERFARRPGSAMFLGDVDP